MLEAKMIDFEGKKLFAVKLELPNAPLILILYRDIIVGCSYLCTETMEKLGNAACIVKGVRTFEDLLNAEIKEATSKALELGARKGMKVAEFLRTIR